jgi:hypothetical protein
MEFKLEDFDKQTEGSINLDENQDIFEKKLHDKIHNKKYINSNRKKNNIFNEVFDSGIINRKIKKYVITKILQISLLLIIGFLIFPFMIKNFMKFNKNTTNNNFKQQETVINKQNNVIIPKLLSEDKKEIVVAKPQKYRGTIYSWKNERGQRVFSNVGFPTDERYTDPKIELQ